MGAAVLYGLHQVFTKLASTTISDGLGGFVVEGSAALTILVFLGWFWFSEHWDQKADAAGVGWSIVTGLCVGVGTILFFLLFQKGRPFSAMPMVLAGGAAIVAVAGFVFFKELLRVPRVGGVVIAFAGYIYCGNELLVLTPSRRPSNCSLST